MSDREARRRMSGDSSCDDDSFVAEGGSVPARASIERDEDHAHHRRKDCESSSDSSSEAGADDVDEDSTSKSGREGISADASEHKTSSSESANVLRKESSSDTEEDVSGNEDDEAVGKMKHTPTPAARKISVPSEADGEMTKEELELSKRETVKLGGDSDSSSSSDDEGEEHAKEKGHSVRVEVDEVSDGELEKPEVAEVVAAKDESEPEAKPRIGGGAEIKRPQFRHSSSSLSDEEIVHESSIKSPSPSPATAGSSSKVVAEKTQQLLSSGQNEARPTTPIGNQSPLPTRANASNLTKIYTEAVEGNNNNTKNSSAERVKPNKDVTQIYTQSIAKASNTPPSSPKPVPSRNKNITQLYTGGFANGDKENGVSPCIAADKLSPKKHNMATAIDKDAIRRAYEDVRSDTTDTEWAVFKFEDNNLKLSGTGSTFKNFKSSFSNEDRGFGYIRINTGDEMSKRAKFVFVTWVGPSVSVMKKAKMSTDKALMKDIIQNMSVELQFENHAEFSHDHFKSQVDKAAGARYGTGERAL